MRTRNQVIGFGAISVMQSADRWISPTGGVSGNGAAEALPQGDPTRAAGEPVHRRLRMLDGWRAVSILTVMAAHMLPLGPSRWELNAAIAADGMAIFFVLSGFLIVSILLRDSDIGGFLVRRLARIVPLAWLALAISFAIRPPGLQSWLANLLFYANLPPFHLVPWSSHFWSLGVEMQFYAAIAAVVLILGARGLYLVPVAALAVTAARVANGTPISIVTWFRVDEILAGGTLALIIHHPAGIWRCCLRPVPIPLCLGSITRAPIWQRHS